MSTKFFKLAILIAIIAVNGLPAHATNGSDSKIVATAAAQAAACNDNLRVLILKSEAPANKDSAKKKLASIRDSIFGLANKLSQVDFQKLSDEEAKQVEEMRICVANLSTMN